MTIAERKARETYDRANPWRPMKEAKPDGTICELLFSDLVGSFDADQRRYFLDASGDWFCIDPPERISRIITKVTNWRPAWVKLTAERRNLIKTRSERRFSCSVG
ncbi:hypothetical protein [Sinorhizobium sp. RAC02]|uniref:hypothetical protein n=1 Tax=Sinorhizobium sp. RAC02 TaxID=1842534 RepID=UPI00083CE46D|nr:hypothetical protein [Sinorhizobium sp. RAC02]AOF91985.1 hypothetical protein BSY16_2291 [Sinorhizobium sp. RAC02]